MRSIIEVKQDYRQLWYVTCQACPLTWRYRPEMEKMFDGSYSESHLAHWNAFISRLGFEPVWVQTFTDGFQAGFQFKSEADQLAADLRSLEEALQD